MFETAKLLESYRLGLEDRAEVMAHPGGLVIALADGVGGAPGGARAAQLLTDVVRALSPRADNLHDARFWCGVLIRADQLIWSDAEAGHTTAVIAAVSEQGIAGASVGDSAAWHIRPQSWDDLTAGQQVRPFIGSGAAKPRAFAAAQFDGTLLVASDGLVHHAPADRICQTARQKELKPAARDMVELVRLRAGMLQDDIAIVLCRRTTT
jgi:serine/threonine protein phosphatase PrpC